MNFEGVLICVKASLAIGEVTMEKKKVATKKASPKTAVKKATAKKAPVKKTKKKGGAKRELI